MYFQRCFYHSRPRTRGFDLGSQILKQLNLSVTDPAPGDPSGTPAGSGGGGSTPPSGNPTALDPIKIQTEGYIAGIAEQRDRTFKKLEKFAKTAGIEIQKDDKGHPSIGLTLEAAAAKIAGSGKPSPKPGDGKPNEHELELEAQLEQVRKQNAELTGNLSTVEQRYQDTLDRMQLTTAFEGSDLLPGALDDAMTSFLTRYKITKTETGDVRVKNRATGVNVLNTQAQAASVKEAVGKFLEEANWYRKATAGSGGPGTRQTSAKQQVTKADLAAGKVDPAKVASGEIEVI